MDKEYHGLADAGTLGATQQPDALNVISATWVVWHRTRTQEHAQTNIRLSGGR